VRVRGNTACPLALHELPPEVYEHEWDMLMLSGATMGLSTSRWPFVGVVVWFAVQVEAREGMGPQD
jgi:hypothetical protein